MRLFNLFLFIFLVFLIKPVKGDDSCLSGICDCINIGCIQCYGPLDGKEVPLSGEKHELTTNSTEFAELRMTREGKPKCVVMRGQDDVKYVLYQTIMFTAFLPAQCHFNEEDTFTVNWEGIDYTGFCSSKNLSNGDDSVLYMYNPYTEGITVGRVILNLLRTVCKMALHITFYTLIVCIMAVIHFYWEKYQQSKNKNSSAELTKEQKNLTAEDAVDTDSVRMDVEETQKTKPSEKLKSSNKVPKVSVRDPKTPNVATATMPAMTPKASTPQVPKTPMTKKDKKENNSEKPTQPSPPPAGPSARPQPRVLENGRIQRVSMNYSNSTYSDLE